MTSTSTNILQEEWAVRDAVMRLRMWGGDCVYYLPTDSPPLIIGSSAGCAIRAGGLRSPCGFAEQETGHLKRGRNHVAESIFCPEYGRTLSVYRTNRTCPLLVGDRRRREVLQVIATARTT